MSSNGMLSCIFSRVSGNNMVCLFCGLTGTYNVESKSFGTDVLACWNKLRKAMYIYYIIFAPKGLSSVVHLVKWLDIWVVRVSFVQNLWFPWVVLANNHIPHCSLGYSCTLDAIQEETGCWFSIINLSVLLTCKVTFFLFNYQNLLKLFGKLKLCEKSFTRLLAFKNVHFNLIF